MTDATILIENLQIFTLSNDLERQHLKKKLNFNTFKSIFEVV